MKANLGKVLSRARKRKGATLRELAGVAGVSNAYLCQLEQSKQRILQISWLNLQRVCHAYEIPIKEMELHMRRLAERVGLLENGKSEEGQ